MPAALPRPRGLAAAAAGGFSVSSLLRAASAAREGLRTARSRSRCPSPTWRRAWPAADATRLPSAPTHGCELESELRGSQACSRSPATTAALIARLASAQLCAP